MRIKNQKKSSHSAGPALAHGPDIVGPTCKPFQPIGTLDRRGAVITRSARGVSCSPAAWR
jgi:hypothetical protein